MPKNVTTIRLDSVIKRKITRMAKNMGLTFSDVAQMLLRAYADGDITIEVRQKS